MIRVVSISRNRGNQVRASNLEDDTANGSVGYSDNASLTKSPAGRRNQQLREIDAPPFADLELC